MYYKEIEKVNLTDSGYLYFIDKEHPLAVGNSGKVHTELVYAYVYD